MHIEFTNPGFEYMLNSIMEFQKDDVSSFWNDSLFYFFKELDKEYAYSLLPEKRREYFEEKCLRYTEQMRNCWKRNYRHIVGIGTCIVWVIE